MLKALARSIRRIASKRRWAQFSLGTMLMLVTALCVWLGAVVNQARHEREGLEAAERLGAMVRFDYQMEYRERPENNIVYAEREPPGPKWLRRFLGGWRLANGFRRPGLVASVQSFRRSRPVGASIDRGDLNSQGCALGYRMRPRWGQIHCERVSSSSGPPKFASVVTALC